MLLLLLPLPAEEQGLGGAASLPKQSYNTADQSVTVLASVHGGVLGCWQGKLTVDGIARPGLWPSSSAAAPAGAAAAASVAGEFLTIPQVAIRISYR